MGRNFDNLTALEHQLTLEPVTNLHLALFFFKKVKVWLDNEMSNTRSLVPSCRRSTVQVRSAGVERDVEKFGATDSTQMECPKTVLVRQLTKNGCFCTLCDYFGHFHPSPSAHAIAGDNFIRGNGLFHLLRFSMASKVHMVTLGLLSIIKRARNNSN